MEATEATKQNVKLTKIILKLSAFVVGRLAEQFSGRPWVKCGSCDGYMRVRFGARDRDMVLSGRSVRI